MLAIGWLGWGCCGRGAVGAWGRQRRLRRRDAIPLVAHGCGGGGQRRRRVGRRHAVSCVACRRASRRGRGGRWLAALRLGSPLGNLRAPLGRALTARVVVPPAIATTAATAAVAVAAAAAILTPVAAAAATATAVAAPTVVIAPRAPALVPVALGVAAEEVPAQVAADRTDVHEVAIAAAAAGALLVLPAKGGKGGRRVGIE